MHESLKQVFDEFFGQVTFDKKLIKELTGYHVYLSNMNSEHIQFFGGNLLGVQVLRFTPRELRKLFGTILDIDYQALERAVRKVPTIYHENSISGDILNLTLFYMMHRFLSATDLTDDQKHRGAYDAALIFCYRCCFALTNNYFSYPAQPAIAQAAYANLSNKHLIKKLGTWSRLCDYRAERIIEKTGEGGKPGLNYQHLVLFNDDIKVTSMIQDSQGRFKSVFSIYYDEFDKVHKSGESISSTSSTIKDADGDIVLKDRVKGVENYINYLTTALSDGDGFIDRDLVTVAADMNGNTSFKTILSVLEWMTEAYHMPKYSGVIDKFISDVLVQAFFYIEHNVPISKRKDLVYVMTTLKNLFLSTRSTDPGLLSIREQGEKLLKAYSKGMTASLMKPTRSAIILYIILRAIATDRS